MSYLTLMSKVEGVSENSYERAKDDGTTETITKVQFSLVVPGMQDRLLAEMPLEAAPKPDILERWELEEAWVVVSADRLRAIGFKRPPARPGEKEAGAMVIFQAAEVREATADERKQLQASRKAAKLHAKERRARRAEEKRAQERRAEQEAVAARPHGHAARLVHGDVAWRRVRRAPPPPRRARCMPRRTRWRTRWTGRARSPRPRRARGCSPGRGATSSASARGALTSPLMGHSCARSGGRGPSR